MKQEVDACEISNQPVDFVNFFPSCNLFSDLADQGLSATGTIRKNCEMKKIDYRSYANKSDGKVELVLWNDNNVVTLCSNELGVYPLSKATRWEKRKT